MKWLFKKAPAKRIEAPEPSAAEVAAKLVVDVGIPTAESLLFNPKWLPSNAQPIDSHTEKRIFGKPTEETLAWKIPAGDFSVYLQASSKIRVAVLDGNDSYISQLEAAVGRCAGQLSLLDAELLPEDSGTMVRNYVYDSVIEDKKAVGVGVTYSLASDLPEPMFCVTCIALDRPSSPSASIH